VKISQSSQKQPSWFYYRPGAGFRVTLPFDEKSVSTFVFLKIRSIKGLQFTRQECHVFALILKKREFPFFLKSAVFYGIAVFPFVSR